MINQSDVVSRHFDLPFLNRIRCNRPDGFACAFVFYLRGLGVDFTCCATDPGVFCQFSVNGGSGAAGAVHGLASLYESGARRLSVFVAAIALDAA